MSNNDKVLVTGASGFVGSAVAREAEDRNWEVTAVGRQDYGRHMGRSFDLIVNANGNASRQRANREPVFDLEASVVSVQRSLVDFKFAHYALISTVDVYNHPDRLDCTAEATEIDLDELCPYGFHKRLAELLEMKPSELDAILDRARALLGPDVVERLERKHPDDKGMGALKPPG